MTQAILFSLLSDTALAVVLLFLFAYVSRVSRNLHGIRAWGAAHLVYTVGANCIDVLAEILRARGAPLGVTLSVNLGAALACAGMAGIAIALTMFVQQRSLHRWELAWLPVAMLPALAAWGLDGTEYGQGIALSAVEVVSLCIMIWQLRTLREAPDRVPARLMMAGCILLIGIYSTALPSWLQGRFGLDVAWVDSDLALWFMLNFCMLTLSSFHAASVLRRSALLDPLTGALNRRGLQQGLVERRAQGKPHQVGGLAVLALDLDRFKAINDAHGHQVGDKVLQAFCDSVRHCIRHDDLFARTGGEEFVVVTAGLEQADALDLGERIRRATERLALPHDVHVGVSVGVAFAARPIPVSRLMDLADQAMYAAKHGGRNRVELRLPD